MIWKNLKKDTNRSININCKLKAPFTTLNWKELKANFEKNQQEAKFSHFKKKYLSDKRTKIIIKNLQEIQKEINNNRDKNR